MLEPYAAPAADTDDPDETAPRARWELPVLCMGLGVVWWIALLIPEASRGFLLGNDSFDAPFISTDTLPPGLSPLRLLWGFVRVVAIVGGGCGSYVVLHRRFRRLRWLTALVCLWAGSALFAMSTGPIGMEPLAMSLVAPAIFIVFAWYIAIPMTILTAIVLTNRLDEKR